MAANRLVDQTNAFRPGSDGSYERLIGNINNRGVCPFCPEHLHEFHTKPIFAETEFWTATDNMVPYTGTSEHLLFIHRQHIETIGEMSPEAWIDLLDLYKGIVRARNILGSTLLMRNGETRFTGASVTHLHAQVLSGTGEDDGQIVTARVG